VGGFYTEPKDKLLLFSKMDQSIYLASLYWTNEYIEATLVYEGGCKKHIAQTELIQRASGNPDLMITMEKPNGDQCYQKLTKTFRYDWDQSEKMLVKESFNLRVMWNNGSDHLNVIKMQRFTANKISKQAEIGAIVNYLKKVSWGNKKSEKNLISLVPREILYNFDPKKLIGYGSEKSPYKNWTFAKWALFFAALKRLAKQGHWDKSNPSRLDLTNGMVRWSPISSEYSLVELYTVDDNGKEISITIDPITGLKKKVRRKALTNFLRRTLKDKKIPTRDETSEAVTFSFLIRPKYRSGPQGFNDLYSKGHFNWVADANTYRVGDFIGSMHIVDPHIRFCVNCDKVATAICSECKMTTYCGKECQKEDRDHFHRCV